jgi:hypothetical protein
MLPKIGSIDKAFLLGYLLENIPETDCIRWEKNAELYTATYWFLFRNPSLLGWQGYCFL